MISELINSIIECSMVNGFKRATNSVKTRIGEGSHR